MIYVKNYSDIKNRTLGLFNHKEAESVYITTRFGIHTFGLKFPIDVAVIDKNNKVVKIKNNLEPGNIFIWPFRFNRVLELPAGHISKHKISIGTKINLKFI